MTELIPSTAPTRSWRRPRALAVAAMLALVTAATTTLATAEPARASTWGFAEVWGRAHRRAAGHRLDGRPALSGHDDHADQGDAAQRRPQAHAGGAQRRHGMGVG